MYLPLLGLSSYSGLNCVDRSQIKKEIANYLTPSISKSNLEFNSRKTETNVQLSFLVVHSQIKLSYKIKYHSFVILSLYLGINKVSCISVCKKGIAKYYFPLIMNLLLMWLIKARIYSLSVLAECLRTEAWLSPRQECS